MIWHQILKANVYVWMEYSAENWYSNLHCWVLKGIKWLVLNSLKDLAWRPCFCHYVVFLSKTHLSTQEYKLLIYYWSGKFNQTCGEISGILPWTGVSNPGSVSCNIPLYGMIRTLNGTLYLAITLNNMIFFFHTDSRKFLM